MPITEAQRTLLQSIKYPAFSFLTVVIGFIFTVDNGYVGYAFKTQRQAAAFFACLAITLTAGELCAVTAGVTKEAADWMYKKNCKVGSGWDWLDVLADAAGIAVGSVLRRLVFDY